MLTRRNFLKTALSATGAASLAGSSAPFLPAIPLSGYPYVQNLCRGRASIVWSSFFDEFGVVEFSEDSSFSGRVVAQSRALLPAESGFPETIYLYRAELGNLNPSTDYNYRVFLNDTPQTFGDGLFRFRTEGRGAFNFLAFGDCGLGTPEQAALATRMAGENAALALLTGDLVYMDGSYAKYQQRFFPYYGDIMRRVPFFPTLGNHDYETQSAGPYLATHALPTDGVPILHRGRYYSFDWGNVHFVSLDTNDTLMDPASRATMLEWLDQDLEKSNRFWKVVFFHHPPFTAGIHDRDPLVHMAKEHIVPVLDRHKVQLVLNGHEHSYQRSHPIRDGKFSEAGEGTVYVITGGGGAHLYPIFSRTGLAVGESAHHYAKIEVQGTSLTVRAIRIDGKEIDRFTLTPQPVICSSFLNPRDATRAVEWDRPVVSIYGRNLAGEERHASRSPFPRILSETRVTMQGRPLPLLSVSGTKIEVQVPHTRQWAHLTVETPNGSAVTQVNFSERPNYQLCK